MNVAGDTALATRKLIPTAVEQINHSWFRSVLGEQVSAADTVQVIYGTATKVKVDLEFTVAGAPPRRQTVWVKTGMEPHSRSIGNEVVYAGETYFYRRLGGRYETRTPGCLYADSDEIGNSAIILDDLGRQGAQFVDAAQPGSPDLIGRGLEAIARYQAASWMAPEIQQDEWLRNGDCYHYADLLAWVWNKEYWVEYSKRPRFERLDPRLRDRDLLLKAHTCLREDWRLRDPWALSHGDSHYGQLYTLPGGEARFLDWQCCQLANWAYDVSYFMVSGPSVADRRKHARDLLAHYLERLGGYGVPNVPSLGAAYELFRAYALHGMGWVICMVEMQPEDVCSAMTERFSAALVDMDSVNVVLSQHG
jgi:hypothetical protein